MNKKDYQGGGDVKGVPQRKQIAMGHTPESAPRVPAKPHFEHGGGIKAADHPGFVNYGKGVRKATPRGR